MIVPNWTYSYICWICTNVHMHTSIYIATCITYMQCKKIIKCLIASILEQSCVSWNILHITLYLFLYCVCLRNSALNAVVVEREALQIVLSIEAVNNTVAISFSASETVVSLFASYLKMVVLLLAPFVIRILSAFVIHVICSYGERATHKTLLLPVNLLVTDLVCGTTHLCLW